MFKLILVCVLLSQIEVTNENNAGEGSFRSAISQAAGDPFNNEIVFAENITKIKLTSRVSYSSALPITITGPIEFDLPDRSQSISFQNCSNVTITDAKFVGSGISVSKGEHARLPTVLTLGNVIIRDAKGIGLWVSDDSEEDIDINYKNVSLVRCSSMGSFLVKNRGDMYGYIRDSVVENNGQISNSDGVQFCQSGFGNLNVEVYGSDFFDNNEDGLEIECTGDGDVDVYIVESNFYDNREENLEISEKHGGDCYVTLEYVDCEGYGPPDRDRNDGIEILEDGPGSLYLNMYECRSSESEFDGLRILPGGPGHAIINIDQCVFTDNLDEGIEIEPREGQDFEGLVGLFIYNSTIKHNWGNGIKAVAPNGGLLEIYGHEFDYKPNLGGNLDLEDSPWTWLNNFAQELD